MVSVLGGMGFPAGVPGAHGLMLAETALVNEINAKAGPKAGQLLKRSANVIAAMGKGANDDLLADKLVNMLLNHGVDKGVIHRWSVHNGTNLWVGPAISRQIAQGGPHRRHSF